MLKHLKNQLIFGNVEFTEEIIKGFEKMVDGKIITLKEYYADPAANATQFQWQIVKYMKQLFNKKLMTAMGQWQTYNIMDRHLISCIPFMKLQRKNGFISVQEYKKMKKEICDTFAKNPAKMPTQVHYLDLSPTIALERIKKRNRDGEHQVTLEFLHLLRGEQLRMLEKLEESFGIEIVMHRVLEDTPVKVIANSILNNLPAHPRLVRSRVTVDYKLLQEIGIGILPYTNITSRKQGPIIDATNYQIILIVAENRKHIVNFGFHKKLKTQDGGYLTQVEIKLKADELERLYLIDYSFEKEMARIKPQLEGIILIRIYMSNRIIHPHMRAKSYKYIFFMILNLLI